ncbi:hypothetical protein TcasGA2_TC000651 [Tribolium castaneum]|uniref:Uncharacterized protein n=1 Tax=Tribolium castaneum TaxID=7070 RepID=D6W925_TRICA|nr:hypothetical protein TcasGA2_TC000651 [Tribolium castaneum]
MLTYISETQIKKTMNKHCNVYAAKFLQEYFISIRINGPIFPSAVFHLFIFGPLIGPRSHQRALEFFPDGIYTVRGGKYLNCEIIIAVAFYKVSKSDN